MKTIISILFIALAVGTYYVYISPEYKHVTSLRVEEAGYLEAEADMKEIKAVYDRLDTEYNNLSKEEIAKIDTFIPESFDSTKFVMELDGLGSRYGIRVKDVQVTTSKVGTDPSLSNNSPFVTHVVTFKFKSPYPNFIQFMKDVENSLTFMDVTQVIFVSNSTGLYDFTVGLQTYSLTSK